MNKNILSVLMAILVSFSVFSFGTSRARAAGIITYMGGQFVSGKGYSFVFEASGFRNRDVRNVTIFVGSNFHRLYCTANKNAKRIVCVGRFALSEYTHETGIIHLGGQAFYVTIPGTGLIVEVCEDGDVKGANVRFEDINGIAFQDFVPGETLEDVQAAAAGQVIANQLAGYDLEGVRGLSCGSPPEPDGGGDDGGGGDEEL